MNVGFPKSSCYSWFGQMMVQKENSWSEVENVYLLIAKILQRRHLIKFEAQAVPEPKSHAL